MVERESELKERTYEKYYVRCPDVPKFDDRDD
jgi:hypothetical protein